LLPEFAFCKIIIEEYKEVFILFEDEQASIKRIVGQVKDENESAIKELLEQFAPLIRNTAFTAFETTGFSGLEVNDLISVGNFAIYNAAKNYQEQRGPFPAYAKLLVRRSIWNYLRENMASSHSLLNEAHSLDEELNYGEGLTLMDSVGDEDPYISKHLLREDDIENMESYLPFSLTRQEKMIILYRLQGYYPQEIMQAMGLSKYHYYLLIENIKLKTKRAF
jgi:RNA polymerase sigma factor (sigma-70 family)